MSFTILGSHADNVSVRTMTNLEFHEEFGGDEPFDLNEQVIVLVDEGNQIAYVIEGDAQPIATWLQGAVDNLAVEGEGNVASDCTADYPPERQCTHPDCMAVRNGVTE